MKRRGTFFPILISLVLLIGIVVGSTSINVSAADGSTTNSLGYKGGLSNLYNNEELVDLSEKQLKMVELTQQYLKPTTDSNGNIEIEIVNREEFKQKIEELSYPMNMSEIQDVVDSFNAYLISPSKITTDGPSRAHVAVGGGGGTVDTSGMSCGDALTIVGYIHSGSYAYAAYLLGVTGGVSVAIPLIVNAAYSVAGILCD